MGARRPLDRVLQTLNYAALERAADGNFYLGTDPAPWFASIFRCDDLGGPIQIAGRSDYLDHFLIDAQLLWLAGTGGKISSGIWVEADTSGACWALEAHALAHADGDILLIQEVGERHKAEQRVMQTAREHLLTEERLEREVRHRTAAIREREQEIAIRLLAAASIRDGETGGHVRRIGMYAAVLGEALGWAPSHVEDIRVAAPMHDIGKIAIPDAILRKPGRLTDDEFRIMQQHTVIGATMLGGGDIPLLQMASEIALCHHEKWNGAGYPHGLKGTQIPIAARVVTIVDVYDAMISRRVYKAPIPEQQVIENIEAASGSDFDPELVGAFEKVLDAIRDIRDRVVN
jgi:response regulator RpfG family c-di-GMP phosphodiesterase